MVDESNIASAAPPETPEPEPTPAPEPQPTPEPEYQLPPWVTAEPGAEEPPPAAPPYPYPPPAYPYGPYPPYAPAPPPQPQGPMYKPYSGDDLLERSHEVVDEHIRTYLRPMAQAIMALREENARLASAPPQLHPTVVNRAWGEVRSNVGESLKEFASDPSWTDKQVRDRVEGYLQTAMKTAYDGALNGDFSGVDALTNRAFLQTVLDYAKRLSGYETGPAPVRSPAARLQTSRPGPTTSRPEITEDLREAARLLGKSEDDLIRGIEERDKWSGPVR